MPRPQAQSNRFGFHKPLDLLVFLLLLNVQSCPALELNEPELVRQVVSAYGGQQVINASVGRGMRSVGKIISRSSLSEASNEFECQVLTMGDKMLVETTVLGNHNVLAYDGKEAWTRTGDWVALSTPTTTKRISEEIKHGLNALEQLDKVGTKVETLPDRVVNGKQCKAIKIVPAHGLWTILYVDPVSKLVVRSQFPGHDSEQGNEITKEVDYSDYRTVAGMPTPFRFVEYNDGKVSTETILSVVTADDTINDSTFTMPEESKVAGIADAPVVLPFEYVGNEIVITAKINDLPEGKFIVDTGASQTVLDLKVAQSIGPLAASTFNVTAGAKAVSLNYTKIAKLKLADVSVENVAALVKDLGSFATAIGQRPAGLIGANVLRRFFVTIDYQNKKLVLSDPQAATVPRGAKVIPTLPVFGSSALVVKGKIDGKSDLNFLVDTGAAFNNLPRTLAEKLETGPLIAVGTIFGLDGKPVEIGAVKYKSLQIGPVVIQDPVFVVQPDKKPGTSGLFSARAMGTLGNPLWSKSKVSIDYRNERLLVELPPDTEKLERFALLIRDIDRAYLRNGNAESAIREYEKVVQSASAERVASAEALATARIASCYADRYQSTKETKWLEAAVKDYERASQIAADSKNRTVEGQVLAQWSMFHLNAPRSNTDLVSSQNLLKRAFNRAPTDATIYAALGTALMKAGKSQEGMRFVNQALMFDPSNWQALWTKFRMAEADSKLGDMRAVLGQIKRYYSDFPQVKDAEVRLARKANTTVKPSKLQAPSAGAQRR